MNPQRGPGIVGLPRFGWTIWQRFLIGVILCASFAQMAAAFEPDLAVYVHKEKEPSYTGAVERIQIELARSESNQEVVRVTFLSGEKHFGFIAVGKGASGLVSGKPPKSLDRYILLSQTGRVLEFKRKEDGRVFLPYSFTLQPELVLPHCLDPVGTFRSSLTFLGETFIAAAGTTGNAPFSIPHADVVELADDVLIGTSRSFRDLDGHRIPLRRFFRDEECKLDYKYGAFDQKDIDRMLAAGFNYFDHVLPEQLNYLYDKPVFFDLEKFSTGPFQMFPEVLFHPGFQGVEDFIDEPAYLFQLHSQDIRVAEDLREMGRTQEAVTRSVCSRNREGRPVGMMSRLEHAGIVLSGITLCEPEIPVWEEFYDTACYQITSPVSGFIHEGRYQHPETVDLLNRTFRTSLPRSPETVFHFYYAFLRGAARLFDKDWGMAIYGQADPDIALQGMKMAYDRGARYIWFWSSDRHHHVPFEEQLALAHDLTIYMQTHPRGDRRSLIRTAKHAIVLPYGFTFPVSDWDKSQIADLWHRKEFSIHEGRTEDGVSYYSVLRVAADKMEKFLNEGQEFDIVVETSSLKAAGYEYVYHVLPEARQMNYTYPQWIHYRAHALLVVLIVFLVVFRGYRTVRWLRRRKKSL